MSVTGSGHSDNTSCGLTGVKSIRGASWKCVSYWSFLEILCSCRNVITPTSAGRGAWQETSDPRGFWSAARIILGCGCWVSQKRGDSQLKLLPVEQCGTLKVGGSFGCCDCKVTACKVLRGVEAAEWLSNSCKKEDGARSTWKCSGRRLGETDLFEFQS